MLGFTVCALLITFIFSSILLHELGHALTARRYGINTYDIVMTPIGGMARIMGMPKKPSQEIAIAIAGPTVSLVTAGLFYVLAAVLSARTPDFIISTTTPAFITDIIAYLGFINLILGCFNLVPALPMDGGRVLRGILALKYHHLKATLIAANIGRTIAVFGGIAAYIYTDSFTIIIIAIYIYFSAGSEIRMAQAKAYQEKMKDSQGGFPFNPFGTAANNSSSKSWAWNMNSNSFDEPSQTHEYENQNPKQDSDWSQQSAKSNRDVIVVDGKAEVIGRKNPENKD